MLDQQSEVAAPRVALGKVGVTAANRRAQQLERRIALVMVVLPFLGLIAAMVLLWGHGFGPVELGLFLGMGVVNSTGIGLGYHRLVTHQSFQTKRWIRAILVICGSMAGQGPVLYWAAIHRRHHSFSDREGDPHSPHVYEGPHGFFRGLWHAHLGWLFVHEITDWGRYITDLLRDPLIFRLNRLYFFWMFLGLLIPAILGGLLTGTWMGALSGFIWGGLVRICISQHITWGVNSLGHVYGSSPFRSRDESRNNLWLALLSAGEGWHNNHHAFPWSAMHGLKWYQLDPNGWMVRILEKVGLAWNVKVPSERMMLEAVHVPGKVPEIPLE